MLGENVVQAKKCDGSSELPQAEVVNLDSDLRQALQEDEEILRCMDWKRQLTIRGLLVGTVIGFAMSIISLRLSLTTGLVPSLNIASGLLGFVCVKFLVRTCGCMMEFTKQENTVIQTFSVALYNCAFILGFGSYYIAMDYESWYQTGSIPSQANEIVNPSLGNIIPYAFCVCFSGIFLVISLRKRMIIDMELTFPSGTATAKMINSLFERDGQALAKKQFRCFAKWFSANFLWDLFAWFFNGGFASFPTFGLKALQWTWNFDFSFNYVGVGMLVPPVVSYSMMVGSIISWGILWPIISSKEGLWFPENTPSYSLGGLLGYKVFCALALILGDGLYTLGKMIFIVARHMYLQRKRDHSQSSSGQDAVVDCADCTDEDDGNERYEQNLRQRIFLEQKIPSWITICGYIVASAVGVLVIPFLFPGTKWYMVLTAYLLVPLFAVPNAYMTGLTDFDMSSTFGKLVIFLFAMWSNSVDSSTGIIAGLATCGVVMCGTSQASVLMQDFKTGYLTRSSPVAMLIAQLVGTTLGCLLTPLAFWMFWSAFDIGQAPYLAPYGMIYRSMAILGTEGFDALPAHCLEICAGLFAFSLVLSVSRDICASKLSENKAKWTNLLIPIPMAMAIPFYIGANLAISIGIGTLINLYWKKKDQRDWENFYVAVASGLIAGDGLFSLPSAFLALGGVNPPILMTFAPNVVGS